MRIIVDAMGGDNAPDEIVKGAIMGAEEFGIEIILTGNGEKILKCLEKMGIKELPHGVEIADASEVVEVEDDPTTVIRTKKDSSLVVGLKMLKNNAADAFVSAGSTGALLSGATLIVKRIRGIRRAAMAPFIPNKGNGFLIIDCGANVDCTPEYLLQFAYMGSFYSKKVLGVAEPRIGLLNIGAEETKGKDLQRDTYALLRDADKEGRIKFVGNVEANSVMEGVCDVLVCDGFSGNVFLKGMEGVGSFILSELKKLFLSSGRTKIAAMLVKNEVSGLKRRLDPSEAGGTALLGISKPVIKAHGAADARTIRNAIRQAMAAVESGITDDIVANIEHMKVEDTADAAGGEK